MRRTCRMVVAAGFAVVAFRAHAGATGAAERTSLDRTAWMLASLPGRTVVAPERTTLRFESGRVDGSDGCNRYSAPCKTTATSIEVGSGAATQMACAAEEVMQQAAAFMTALTGAKSYRVHEEQLELTAADGAVLATLVVQPQSIAETSWKALGISNGKGAVASLVTGSTVTMTFDAGNKVSGSAGCNQYTSTYQSEGAKLRFTPAAATRRMCSDAGVMEQEQALFKALESVATMRIEGDRLELRTADGALAVSLVRSASP